MSVYLSKHQGTVRIRTQTRDSYGVVSLPVEHIIVIDNTPPEFINLRGANGLTATQSSSVILDIIASDNISKDILQWRHRINTGSWSIWTDLDNTSGTVSGLVSGANRINVQVKDEANNVSERSIVIFKV